MKKTYKIDHSKRKSQEGTISDDYYDDDKSVFDADRKVTAHDTGNKARIKSNVKRRDETKKT